MISVSRLPTVAIVLGIALTSPVASAFDRLGLTGSVYGQAAQMSGEQWINASRIDESFAYGTFGVTGTLYALFKPHGPFRFGPGVRFYGPYGPRGNNEQDYGFLGELFLTGEFSVKAIGNFEAVIGARTGLDVVVPTGELAEEISRLQREGVGVWGLPRIGWLGGLSVGARHPLSEKLWVRGDLGLQYQQIFLFAHEQTVDEFRFRKNWLDHGIRVSLSASLELGL